MADLIPGDWNPRIPPSIEEKQTWKWSAFYITAYWTTSDLNVTENVFLAMSPSQSNESIWNGIKEVLCLRGVPWVPVRATCMGRTARGDDIPDLLRSEASTWHMFTPPTPIKMYRFDEADE